MKKITLALFSVLLITALGGCKSTTPQTADKNVKPALMWFDAEANFERFSHPDSIDYYLTKIKSLALPTPLLMYALSREKYCSTQNLHLRCANGKDMNVKTLTIWDILSRKRMNWE